jgi:hypothetical protein
VLLRQLLSVGALAAAVAAAPAGAITFGQVDTFEDGTLQGWAYAVPSQLTNEPDGGPLGFGDNYLQIVSTGLSTAGGRLVVTNGAQWAGNYTAAGVGVIELDVANLGSQTIHLRLALEGPSAVRWASSTPVQIAADAQWVHLSFALDASLFTQVEGAAGASFGDTLANVVRIRFNHTKDAPAWNGEVAAHTLGLDNIEASPIPEPGTLFLLALGLSGLAFRRGLSSEPSRRARS